MASSEATSSGARSAELGAQGAATVQDVFREAVKTLVSIVSVAHPSAKGKSRKEGPVSEGIDAAAQTMQAAVVQIVEERIASHGSVEGVGFVAPEDYLPGYDAALAAGAEARTRIFNAADMLSSEMLAARLGVSRETVNQRRRNGELLALENERRGFRYPAWQIEPGVRDAVPQVLKELGADADCWAAYLFFTQENPLLGGMTPLQALQVGQFSKVLRAAGAMREELV